MLHAKIIDLSKEKINLEKAESFISSSKFGASIVFYGTVREDNEILAVGGRVLNFISLSDDLSSARDNIHNNLNKLNWSEGFYRKDIAFKVIGKWESYQVTLKGRKY